MHGFSQLPHGDGLELVREWIKAAATFELFFNQRK